MTSSRLIALALLALPLPLSLPLTCADAAEPAKPPVVKPPAAPAVKAPAPAPAAKAPAPAPRPPVKPPEPLIPEIAPDAKPVDSEIGAAAGGAEITVYLNNLAMVREHRSLRLPSTFTRLTLGGVPAGLQPETALFDVVKGPPLRVMEQNFDFDLLSPDKLLEKAVGREVTVVTTNPATGAETSTRATILSSSGGLVVQMNGKMYPNPPGRIVYDSLPPGLHARPALVMTVAGTPNQDLDTELSYLASGLNWHANYVLHYDADAGRMDMSAWASITNTSGMDFKDARLKLVAGDVDRLNQPRPLPQMAMAAAVRAAPAAAPGPLAEGMTEEAIAGNHIYTLPRPASLAPNETKQVALLSVEGVPVKRDYVVRGQPNMYTQLIRQQPGLSATGATGIELSFKNDATTKLGAPLPPGIMRVYSADAQGAPQFMGESRMDNVADGGTVNIDAGHDYDLPVTREQLNFVRASEQIALSVWRITVRNAKAKPMTVRVVEPIPGQWEITKESEPHTKNDAGQAEWSLQVPPKGQVVLEYNAKTQL